MKFNKKNVLFALLSIFVIIQFIPVDKSNPSFSEEEDFLRLLQPPSDIANLIKGACYDCHSNQTVYPWYTYIAPASFFIKGHVKEGREHLNFSTWMSYDNNKKEHKLEECAEEVEKHKMPMKSYTWMHGAAKLSTLDRERLVKWFEEQRLKFQ